MNYPTLTLCAALAVAALPHALAGQAVGAIPGAHATGSFTQKVPEADIAFAPRIASLGDGWVLEYRILPGFYLYRDRIKVSLAGKPLTLEWPTAEQVSDPNFGAVMVYRSQLIVPLPDSVSGSIRQQLPIKIVAQGCSDGGFCYAPFEQTVRLGKAL